MSESVCNKAERPAESDDPDAASVNHPLLIQEVDHFFVEQRAEILEGFLNCGAQTPVIADTIMIFLIVLEILSLKHQDAPGGKRPGRERAAPLRTAVHRKFLR